MVKTLRLSDQDLVLTRTYGYFRAGWTVVRPVYVDWFWRGYSIKLEWDPQRGAVE